MKNQKALSLAAISGLTGLLAGCSMGQNHQSHDDAIHVITREEGSGTQSAFLDLFKIDAVREDAEISNSTSVVISTVQNDPNAIGYISLGSLQNTVKAAAVDGVAANSSNVKNGTYAAKRPFLLVYKDDQNELIKDFVDYIHSAPGAKVIDEQGYIPFEDTQTWTAKDLEGSITVGGSSSVSPLMEKLAEAYMKENPKAKITVMQSDSSVGISSTADGTYDIGMSSRLLKPQEQTMKLWEEVIALDGIALIVNANNPVDDLSQKDITGIYTGEIKNWNDVK